MIKQIYRFEAVGAIPLGVNAAVMALLYGFGKTRVTLVMNFCRVFLFRVPVLWALQQFTDLGNVSAGIVMAVSNVASGVLAAVVGVIEIRRIYNTYDARYFWRRTEKLRNKNYTYRLQIFQLYVKMF